MEIISYGLVGQGLIRVNMAAYATTIAYIDSKLNNITGSIKEFIVEHQTYIPKDILDAVGVVGGCYFMLEGGSFVATVALFFVLLQKGI
ncbi:hypothetical protein [Methanothermobacter tenebrarum]|uniref:Uncharacterized protein n=2 Tax=Methanobacteriaceae TaxID=2159 RepID=O26175_METTH|nr:hypothetical protein [Methanothermobacter tenebrarum]AAB84575.1 unknown [Methanothermobacter thermautotrophicus str. Delta H]